jgi:hypothetical protein
MNCNECGNALEIRARCTKYDEALNAFSRPLIPIVGIVHIITIDPTGGVALMSERAGTLTSPWSGVEQEAMTAVQEEPKTG